LEEMQGTEGRQTGRKRRMQGEGMGERRCVCVRIKGRGQNRDECGERDRRGMEDGCMANGGADVRKAESGGVNGVEDVCAA
jgi:hypothetical protein